MSDEAKLYAGLSYLLDRVGEAARKQQKLPSFHVRSSKQEREYLEREAMLKELARRYVGGM